MESFLRTHPYLKPVNICNLFNRILKASNNSLMLLYNTTRDTYELHSIKSFMYNGESLNAVIEDDMLHGWLVTDILANDIKKFGSEISDEREINNKVIEDNDQRRFDLLTTRTLKTIETMVGREI